MFLKQRPRVKKYRYLPSSFKADIPRNIFQTWCTKELPPHMNARVELLKVQNPEFQHFLFDDNDCRDFIQKHFHPDVLRAYDSLIPGAYKADLWRLCVLFIHGGIYMDVKFSCVNGFKLINLTNRTHFVKDRFDCGLYNAFICCNKGNIFLYKCIRQIVSNVKHRYYGPCCLSPTGPKLLGNVMKQSGLIVNVDLFHYNDGGYILYKNSKIISTVYHEYQEEQKKAYEGMRTERYDALWNKRAIYA